jgi:exopolyphosphatase/guanosine-5'-triphosphate,3'-diphosphate pyrophosphatase
MSPEVPTEFAPAAQSGAMEIAILDLGSATFHLQHIRVDDPTQFATSLDEKRSISLGAQVFADGFLDRRSWLESLDAVQALLEISRGRCPERTVVVATSAIRSASNGARLVREIERLHRVSVCVLEPREEARLAYLGQSTSPVVAGRRAAVIDLGGGSAEVAVGEGARCLHAASLPLGAVRLRATQTGEVYSAADASSVAKIVRDEARDVLHIVRELCPEIVVFGSGSARAARHVLMHGSATPGKAGPIDTAHVRSRLETLLDRPAAQLIDLGVEPARASTVLVAATIMAQMLELLDVDAAWVSDKGLRDGVALEVYREHVSRLCAAPRSVAVA